MDNVVLTLVLAGVTTLIGLIVGDIYARVKLGSRKYKTHKEEEQKRITKEAVTEVLSSKLKAELAPIKSELDKSTKIISELKEVDIPLLKKANRDSLRNQLYDIYDRCIEYKQPADVENEAEMFDSYKALNGNHGCDSRHALFVKKPLENEWKRTHSNVDKK